MLTRKSLGGVGLVSVVFFLGSVDIDEPEVRVVCRTVRGVEELFGLLDEGCLCVGHSWVGESCNVAYE
jgi:hypothetical protein